jgi:hypothetical protein
MQSTGQTSMQASHPVQLSARMTASSLGSFFRGLPAAFAIAKPSLRFVVRLAIIVKTSAGNARWKEIERQEKRCGKPLAGQVDWEGTLTARPPRGTSRRKAI